MSLSIRNTPFYDVTEDPWLNLLDPEQVKLAQTNPHKLLAMMGGLNLHAKTKVDFISFIFKNNTSMLPTIVTALDKFGLKRKHISQLSKEIILLMSRLQLQHGSHLLTLLAHRNLRKKDLTIVCQNISADYYKEVGNTLRINKNDLYYKRWSKLLYRGNLQFSDEEKKNLQYLEDVRIAKDLKRAISNEGL